MVEAYHREFVFQIQRGGSIHPQIDEPIAAGSCLELERRSQCLQRRGGQDEDLLLRQRALLLCPESRGIFAGGSTATSALAWWIDKLSNSGC